MSGSEMGLMWAYEIERVWGELAGEPEVGMLILTDTDRGEEWDHEEEGGGGFSCVRCKEGSRAMVTAKPSMRPEERN